MQKFYNKIVLLLSLLLLSTQQLSAQQNMVSGRITDRDGAPVIGATVVVVGTSRGVSTDVDGHYVIAAREGEMLSVSHLEAQTQELPVGKANVIDVVMQPSTKSIDEVIVVAYGTSKKSSFTGSAEVVSAESLSSRPVTEVTKSLDGKVAGVMTTSGSGQPGSGASVVIRGFGSINAASTPLIVVDGMPYDGDLNSLNSADVESMTVLKDASAGALYGARGANGVLLITTKRSRESGKINVDFSSKISLISRAIPKYDTVDAKEYMELMYNAVYNDLVYTEGYLPADARAKTPARLANEILGTDNIYNPYNRDVAQLFDANGKIVGDARLKYDEDWIDRITAASPVRQEYQVSLSGSSPTAKYMVSISYLNEDGILKTTDFSRYTGRANVDLNITKWLDAGMNISYAHTDSNFLGADGSTNSNVWYSAQMMAPIYPIYKHDADGNYLLDESGNKQFDYGSSRPAGAQNNKNSVATLYDDEYYSYSDNLSARTYLRAEWKGITLSTNFGLDNTNTNESTNYNPYNGNAAGMGRLTKEYARVMSYTWNQLAGYQHSWGGHSLDVLAGHEFYGYRMNYLNGERTGFPFGDYDDLAMGSTVSQAYSATDKYYINSYLSRVNYNYADRYYFSASFRMDASSRFERSNRWGAFWSVGASWRMSEEKFMQSAEWLDNLTLKASYGVQGNDNIGTYYAWQALYNMTYANANYSGAMISTLENKNISWESNGNMNVGVEFRMFNRFYGTVEYYNRKTTDLLLQYPKAPSQGLEGYYANVGSMVNRGFDISLGCDVIRTKDWSWSLNVIASTVKNKILKLTGNETSIVSGVYINKPDYAINSFYMAKSAGVDPVTGEQLYWAYSKDADGERIEGSDYITSDATLAANSKYILGSRIPKLYGSVSTGVKWRALSLDVMVAYSIGGKVYDTVYQSMMEPSFVGQVYHSNALRSWKQAGDVTDVPRTTTTLTTTASDRFLVNASYLSIKNLTLGYDFAHFVRKAGISKLKVYVAVDNPWIFTHLKGMNPQSSFSGSTSFSYVPTRSVTFGIDLKL